MAGIVLVASLGIACFTDNRFLQDATIVILLWAGLASAWNIAGGFAGQLSLGHAAFFALGAYTSTLLKLHWDLSPWFGMIVGGVLAIAISGFMAYAAVRLRGPYFGLVTIAFATVLQIIAARWYSLTRGNEGLTIPFRPGFSNFMFADKLSWTIVVLGYVVIVYGFSVWLSQSRMGFQMAGMREDEEAARALGVHSLKLKVIAIAISAFFTALGGTFYAQYVGFIDPAYVFSFDLSIKFALICIIGGLGTSLGPILGAIIITALEMYLRAKWGGGRSGFYLMVYGALLMVVVRVMPEGLIAGAKSIKRWTGAGRAS
jgi:branched-chain amino acid transport system permease protein